MQKENALAMMGKSDIMNLIHFPLKRSHVSIVILLVIILIIFWGSFSILGNRKTTNTSSSLISSTPKGIFAVLALDNTESISFSDQTYTNPNISGVAPRISWNAIEPEQDQYQWQMLDDIFQKATANKKKVVIIPVAGFDTPQWALQGVQTAQFDRKYGKDAGEAGILPIPWDQVYLNRWFDFLSQIAKRYGDNQAFVMIGASGPTSVSAEMSLPNSDQDIQYWISLGYTPSKYENAWKQTFAEYARIFPHQHFALALYPGLPINDQGQVDQSASTATRQAIIDLGASTYPNQFSLQTSGLNGSKQSTGGGYDIVLNDNGKIATGFQMSTSATNKPAKMGDASNSINALKLSVDKGISPNSSGETVSYLEIYETDIDNPDMQSVLQYGQQLLLNGKAVQPTIPSNDTLKKHGRKNSTNVTQIDDSDPSINY